MTPLSIYNAQQHAQNTLTHTSCFFSFQPFFRRNKRTEPPEEKKNDFQNAIKRNLHSWADWRRDVNDSLVESLFTGQPMYQVAPLNGYLQHHSRPLPTENPRTLLTYSASEDTNTHLKRDHFLSFGIPRIKKSEQIHQRASRGGRTPQSPGGASMIPRPPRKPTAAQRMTQSMPDLSNYDTHMAEGEFFDSHTVRSVRAPASVWIRPPEPSEMTYPSQGLPRTSLEPVPEEQAQAQAQTQAQAQAHWQR